jgi:hypothetical protein
LNCPACFDFSHEPADRAAGITVDGNFQHIRLKYRSWSTYETFEPRKFVAYGVWDFATPDATVDDASCDNKFHATGGWGKTLNTASKKHSGRIGPHGHDLLPRYPSQIPEYPRYRRKAGASPATAATAGAATAPQQTPQQAPQQAPQQWQRQQQRQLVDIYRVNNISFPSQYYSSF